jgi:hypothetical protein
MKHIMRVAAAMVAAAGLSACAVPAETSTQVASAEREPSDVVCFFEAPTGTNRRIRRCMSKDEYNKGVEAARRLGDEIKVPPPPPQ